MSHYSYEICLSDMRLVLIVAQDWLSEVGLKISEDKFAIMCFTRHRLAIPQILCAMVKSYKYFGLMLDQKLLWIHHPGKWT